MNWMLIAAILIVAANIVWGYRQGFLRTIYRMVQWILILVFITWANPYVSDYLMTHTNISQTIQEKSEEYLRQMVEESGTMQEGNEDAFQVVPSVILDKMLEKTNMYENLANQITNTVIDGISYLLVLVSAVLLIRIIEYILRIIEKIPIIEGMNQIFGLLLGFVKGILFLWVLMAIVAFFAATTTGNAIITYMCESPLLKWMYENNFILNIIYSFF